MSVGVFWWWCFLCTVAALNIAAWSLSLAALRRHQPIMAAETYRALRLQLVLSGLYVFGCAFRSVVPVFDVPRLTLVDTWLSSVIIGRSVATVAELSFVAQWALMMGETARATGSTTAKWVARSLVPLIVIAETCSWTAVLTTANLGHVFENSIWGFSVALLVLGMLATRPRCPPEWRPALVVGCVLSVAYVAFMFLVDVPMYWERWMADEASGKSYLSLTQGVHEVSARSTISHLWEDWQSEVLWMTLYFSVAVWISIAHIHLHAAVRGVWLVPLPFTRAMARSTAGTAG